MFTPHSLPPRPRGSLKIPAWASATPAKEILALDVAVLPASFPHMSLPPFTAGATQMQGLPRLEQLLEAEL